MKTISTILVATSLLSFTACMNSRDWIGGGEYLSNDRGMVSDCQGNFIGTSNDISEADLFWRDNNLPKGTTDFVCKDGKAYLPNKVTDCQGNLIAKQPGGIDQFKLNNNFPRYEDGEMVWYTAFKCEGSQVVPIDYTKE